MTLSKTITICLTIIIVRSLLFFSLFGQNVPDKIAGFVLDATTKEGIPGVNIIDITKGRGTTTDATGRFSIPVEAYPARIVFQHISYFPDTVTIADNKEFNKLYANNLAMIFLRTNVFQINEVTVKANARKLFELEKYHPRLAGITALSSEYYMFP